MKHLKHMLKTLCLMEEIEKMPPLHGMDGYFDIRKGTITSMVSNTATYLIYYCILELFNCLLSTYLSEINQRYSSWILQCKYFQFYFLENAVAIAYALRKVPPV